MHVRTVLIIGIIGAGASCIVAGEDETGNERRA